MGISEAIAQYREFDRRIWVLSFSQLIVATRFSVVLPFLAIYFHEGMGIPIPGGHRLPGGRSWWPWDRS
ncbi:MAG: hypothetical protein ACLFUV_02205 [Methanomassiliicoccales archaeon]